MPYFQSLTTQPVPVKQPVPQPPGSAQTSGTSSPPKPSDLDPSKSYDFSEYGVGGVWVSPGAHRELNCQGARTTLCVLNIGDRAIQIGSHIHLAEVNKSLLFFDQTGAEAFDDFLKNNQPTRDELVKRAGELALDRSKTTPARAPWGYRLDIAPGDSKRFSPASALSERFDVVEIRGERKVPGLTKGKTDAALD